jgi:uncharacterized SAM-binding protein YcdF (DUF218 family)
MTGSFPGVFRVLGGTVLLAFLALAFTPLAPAVDARLDHGEEVSPADAVVVLGAGVSPDGILTAHSLRRAVAGIALFRRGLAPKLLLLGPVSPGGVAETEVRARLARDLGVPEGAIVVEARGLTTRQEALLARQRLPAARRILLVTGAHHMRRARALFERAGLQVLRAPVAEVSARPNRPDERLQLTRLLVQEALAWLYNRWAGYV